MKNSLSALTFGSKYGPCKKAGELETHGKIPLSLPLAQTLWKVAICSVFVRVLSSANQLGSLTNGEFTPTISSKKSSRCRKDRSTTLTPNAFLRSSVALVGSKLKRTSVSLPLSALVTPSRSHRSKGKPCETM